MPQSQSDRFGTAFCQAFTTKIVQSSPNPDLSAYQRKKLKMFIVDVQSFYAACNFFVSSWQG